MGIFETLMCAIGLRFPEIVSSDNSNIYYDIKELIENAGIFHYKGKRPIIIHPEGTKTNGLGVLNIDEDLIKMLDVASNFSLNIHSIRFDQEFRYWSPINTTDSLGLWNLICSIKQFVQKMKI